jgi:hypothetical protein
MTTRWIPIVLALATLAPGLAGCKKQPADAAEKPAPPADMKAEPAPPADMKAEPAAAPAASLEARVLGVWIGDFERMKADDPEVQKLDPDQQAKIKAGFEKLIYRFEKGTMVLTDHEGNVEKGTWTVKSQEGNKLVIESTAAGGMSTTVTETLELTGDDQIAISKAGDKDRIYLRRKK